MKIAQGLYNNHGRVQIRVFPYGTKQPYYESGFGCWCEKHIKEAERRLRTLRDEIDDGVFAKNQALQELKFTEGWDLFFKRHYEENSSRSAKSIRNAKYIGLKFKALWPTTLHHEFTPKHIQDDFITGTHLNPGSLKRQLGLLESYFNRMEEWVKAKEITPIKLPDFNPVLSKFKPENTKYTGRKHLEVGELQRFKDWCLNNDKELWVSAYAAMTTMLRKGDLREAAGKSAIQGVASKTGKVFVLPGVVDASVRLSNFQKRWARARRETDLEWFHWHWWRAQGAKLMRVLGVPESTVQEILQHSNVQTTREYTGDPEWARPAVDKLRTFLDNLAATEAK